MLAEENSIVMSRGGEIVLAALHRRVCVNATDLSDVLLLGSSGVMIIGASIPVRNGIGTGLRSIDFSLLRYRLKSARGAQLA